MAISQRQLNILIVDDDEIDRAVYKKYLTADARFAPHIFECTSVSAAIHTIGEKDIDCLLLDYNLPGDDGITLLEQLRETDDFSSLAIVFLTGEGSEHIAVEAMKSGADDYLSKNELSASRLINALEVAVENKTLKDAVKKKSSELAFLAIHDPMTQCKNRAGLFEALDRHVELARRYQRSLAVLFIDFDHFKHINDNYGHAIGDKLLIEAADRLRTTVRKTDVIARMGGDEFVVCLLDIANYFAAGDIANKIIEAIKKSFHIDGVEIRIGVSIGIVCYPRLTGQAETLVQAADIAMYMAKRKGRNTYEFYSPQLSRIYRKKNQLEQELNFALSKDQLYLVYQPQIDLASNALVAIEALLRWQRDDDTLSPPAEFIPIAEQSGLIDEIGLWVIEKVCQQAREWQRQLHIKLPIAFNVSGYQLDTDHLLHHITDRMANYELTGDYFEIEITESALMLCNEKAEQVLNQIQALGLTISIDDFGTGYSSFSKLFELQYVNKLKIDKSFIQRIGTNPMGETITRSIIELGHNLGLKITAEGIETSKQLTFLQQTNCEYGQGAYLSMPLTADQFIDYYAHTVQNEHRNKL